MIFFKTDDRTIYKHLTGYSQGPTAWSGKFSKGSKNKFKRGQNRSRWFFFFFIIQSIILFPYLPHKLLSKIILFTKSKASKNLNPALNLGTHFPGQHCLFWFIIISFAGADPRCPLERRGRTKNMFLRGSVWDHFWELFLDFGRGHCSNGPSCILDWFDDDSSRRVVKTKVALQPVILKPKMIWFHCKVFRGPKKRKLDNYRCRKLINHYH